MNSVHLFFSVFVFFLFCLVPSECMFPWTKKWKAESQVGIINDMSKELKLAAENLPSQKDIANKIHKIDSDVINKLDEEIVKEENLSKHKPHVCEDVSYERDYSYLCPQDWVKNSAGQCWGMDYEGHCDALHYFQEYSDEEKREFELNCCVLWPQLKKGVGKKRKMDILRGSINANTGTIVKPKNI